jgi:MFS family permease
MAELRTVDSSAISASFALGRKLDSIPFSSHHISIIGVLALVGFIEGYDLVMTGSLLVLAKAPLQLTGSDIRWLAAGPTFMLCIGGFAASAVSDHWSRKAIMMIGVIATTFFTLLIPLVQTAEQLIIVRLLTGLGAGSAVSAAFPIAAELMPAQHRRTYGAVYEMALAASFTVVPFIAGLLAGNENAFRFLALPGGLSITVVPVLIYFVLPESPRWYLRKGQPQAAVDIVNRMISRSGNRVPPLTVQALGDGEQTKREELPPYSALFARGQVRRTTLGILSGVCAGTAYSLISVLLPKALNDQGFAVGASLALTSIIYAASFFGKSFTGFLMEIIGRRWTIFYALIGLLPGLALMLPSQRAGAYAGVVMVAGGLIIGFTVLSAFTACRVYLSEQFPTPKGWSRPALRRVDWPAVRRGAGAVPDGTAYRLGADILRYDLCRRGNRRSHPLVFGRETVGRLETVTEEVPALA